VPPRGLIELRSDFPASIPVVVAARYEQGLSSTDEHAMLVELGYVSNPGDLKQLVSESWRSRDS